jgi:hypothetical protein
MVKRRFRFASYSLKSLFLAISVVACLLGWIKWRGSDGSAPHLMLRKAGAQVKFDWEAPDATPGARPADSAMLRTLFGDYYDVDKIYSVDFSNCHPSASTLRHLQYCQSAKVVSLRDAPFGDAECKWLANMPRLKSLGVERTKITDGGAGSLARCKNLRSLNLSGCHVTDQAVGALSESLSLTGINLDHTLVTGESLRYLSKMPSIQTISIWGCPVSDADLKPLANCPALYYLDLSGTQITADALPELAKIKGLKDLTAIHTPLSRAVGYRSVSREEISRLLPGVTVSLVGNR